MLADGLTKVQSRQSFLVMLGSGCLKLVNDETFTAAKKKDKNARAASTAMTFGKNKVAERIAMVVMAQAVTAAEAVGDNIEDDWFFYVLMTLLLANTLLFLYGGWSCLWRCVQKVAQTLYPAESVQTVSIGSQTDVCLQALGPVLDEADLLRSALERVTDEAQRCEAQRVRQIADLQREVDRLTRDQPPFALSEYLAAYDTPRGSCWHAFEDCQTLGRSTQVHEKPRLCQVCVDRARANRRAWVG